MFARSPQLSTNTCIKCREKEKFGDTVQCEKAPRFTCWATGKRPEDKALPMVSNKTGTFIIRSWEAITAISAREQYKKSKEKKTAIYYLPTLEKLEFWVSLQCWKIAPVTKWEFLEYITIFHSVYRSEAVK